MNIREWFEGDDQDRKIETMQKVFALRDDISREAKTELEKRIGTCLTHSMFGMIHGYPPCCVIEFVRQSFDETFFDSSRAIDGFQPCHRCFSDFV